MRRSTKHIFLLVLLMNAPGCDSKKPEAAPEVEEEGGGGTLQTGTRNCTILPACTADGGTSCVANATYTAALTTGLSSKVLIGNTVAGVAGNVTLPAVGNVLTTITYGASGTSSVGTLTVPVAGNVLASNGAYGVSGTGSTPTLTLPSVANVRTTQGTFGVGGTGTTPTLADCAADGGTGCVTVASYPAAKLANFSASNIQGGVTIAGIAGSAITSVACSSDGEQNCSVSGVYKAANITGISTWDLRAGLSLGGITGALKTNCRNAVSTAFNWDDAVGSLPNTAQSGGAAYDYWDTVDDYLGFATNKVTAWSSNTYCDSSTWTDVTTTDGGSTASTCASSPAACQYKDNITNLVTTKVVSASSDWSAAVNACASSTYGGYAAGTWRLPAQKELMSQYEHGVVSLVSANFMTLVDMRNYFWSSTTRSDSSARVWYVYLAYGNTNNVGKAHTSALSVSCVR